LFELLMFLSSATQSHGGFSEMAHVWDWHLIRSLSLATQSESFFVSQRRWTNIESTVIIAPSFNDQTHRRTKSDAQGEL
jgi:hypothetical protein